MAEPHQVEEISEIAAAAVQQAIRKPPPPAPLPPGWVLKESRSNPDFYFYFHQETGECSWKPPAADSAEEVADARSDLPAENQQNVQAPTPKKRSRSEAQPEDSNKRTKTNKAHVLHILRKHKDSRRPSSWRVPEITISKETATEELEELMEMLNEVKDDPVELRATMEELARTESDCSSAKRGGDLGPFGPGKMQREFEKVSFELGINELSNVVSTNSGVHVILRIG